MLGKSSVFIQSQKKKERRKLQALAAHNCNTQRTNQIILETGIRFFVCSQLHKDWVLLSQPECAETMAMWLQMKITNRLRTWALNKQFLQTQRQSPNSLRAQFCLTPEKQIRELPGILHHEAHMFGRYVDSLGLFFLKAGSSNVDQAGLKRDILLPQPPYSAWLHNNLSLDGLENCLFPSSVSVDSLKGWLAIGLSGENLEVGNVCKPKLSRLCNCPDCVQCDLDFRLSEAEDLKTEAPPTATIDSLQTLLLV